jgi:acyl-CoA thioester hydrolase
MTDTWQELLRGFPSVVEVPVLWGDMDAYQHVNNTVYFRYFETGRIAYFQQIGFLGATDEQGIGPILGSASCRFRFPLTYPDTVSIGTTVTNIGSDRITMCHVVVSQRHGRVAAEGEGVVVSFDYRVRRKAPLPDAIRQQIEAMQNVIGDAL